MLLRDPILPPKATVKQCTHQVGENRNIWELNRSAKPYIWGFADFCFVTAKSATKTG